MNEGRKMSNIYIENGYENRQDYLEDLGEQYGPNAVASLASMLGPEEDFDALPAMLEELEYFC